MPTKTLVLTSLAPGTDELTVTLGEGKNYTGAEAKLNVTVDVLPKADPVLENNSWETIAAYAAAGKAGETWQLGDTHTFVYSGSTYRFQIVDFDNDDLDPSDEKYNDASYNNGTKKAAITFVMVEVLKDEYAMNTMDDNSCSWRDSQVRTKMLTNVRQKVSADLTSVIRMVTKKTAHSADDSTIISTADDFFLASEYEACQTRNYSYIGEGLSYKYLNSGVSRVKRQNGTECSWTLRSPVKGDDRYFAYVNLSGKCDGAAAASNGGIVLCCCI